MLFGKNTKEKKTMNKTILTKRIIAIAVAVLCTLVASVYFFATDNRTAVELVVAEEESETISNTKELKEMFEDFAAMPSLLASGETTNKTAKYQSFKFTNDSISKITSGKQSAHITRHFEWYKTKDAAFYLSDLTMFSAGEQQQLKMLLYLSESESYIRFDKANFSNTEMSKAYNAYLGKWIDISKTTTLVSMLSSVDSANKDSVQKFANLFSLYEEDDSIMTVKNSVYYVDTEIALSVFFPYYTMDGISCDVNFDLSNKTKPKQKIIFSYSVGGVGIYDENNCEYSCLNSVKELHPREDELEDVVDGEKWLASYGDLI